MSNYNVDPNKLSTLKTYMLIAFIFCIIGLVLWVISGLVSITSYLSAVSLANSLWGGNAPSYVTGAYLGGLIAGIVLLIFIVPTILVFLRVYKMYNAVNRGDIATLKAMNNMMWAIIALIFSGVIPGVMLIISNGPINELGTTPPTAPMMMQAQPAQPRVVDLDKLAKLKALLDSGVITQEEFDAQKAALIRAATPAPSPAQAPASNTVEAQLTKLKALYDAGILTKQEYDQQRAAILNKM